MPPTLPSTEPAAADIRHVAYHLWLQSGCPAGRELDHWFAAETLLRARTHLAPAKNPRRGRIKFPRHSKSPFPREHSAN
jgi:hypothetical protein